jgi:hypothetical protein
MVVTEAALPQVGELVSEACARKHIHAPFLPPEIITLPLRFNVVGEAARVVGDAYNDRTLFVNLVTLLPVSPDEAQ